MVRKETAKTNCLAKSKAIRLAVIALALTLVVSVGAAAAFFTTYVRAEGGHELLLGDETYIEEEVNGMEKTISIANKGDTNVYVRVKLLYSDYNNEVKIDLGSDWKLEGDGYYYYNKILKPGESTSNIVAEISVKGDKKPMDQFDVIVVNECTQYIWDDEGMGNTPAYPGWANRPANVPQPQAQADDANGQGADTNAQNAGTDTTNNGEGGNE